MSALRQKTDGRYYIDYRLNGKRHRETITHNGRAVRDPAAAQVYYTQWCAAQESTPVTLDTAPRIAEVVTYYRDTYLHATNAAKASHAAAGTHCEAFMEWCRAQRIGNCQQLSAAVLSRWSADLQRTRNARTARNYLTTIRTAINVAINAGILESNPIRGKWVLPKVEDVERHPLTLEELREVMRIFEDVPIVLWICLTGNRPSDARTLRFRDVDLESRTVDRLSIKARALRNYEISHRAARVIETQAHRPHAAEDVVFLSSTGHPWSADGLLNSFKARLRAVEYPRALNLRDLRHSFGTILAGEMGVPLPELQILMGHTDIKTTMQYIRPTGAREYLTAWDSALPEE